MKIPRHDAFPRFKAKTTVEINGACIDTIPIGTEFIVSGVEKDHYANAYGLVITLIYHDEYEIIGPIES